MPPKSQAREQIYLFEEPGVKAAIKQLADGKVAIGVRNKELIEAWEEYFFCEEIAFQVEPGSAFKGSFKGKYKWQIVVSAEDSNKLAHLDFDRKPSFEDRPIDDFSPGDRVKVLYNRGGSRSSCVGKVGTVEKVCKQINGFVFINVSLGNYDSSIVQPHWIKKVGESL